MDSKKSDLAVVDTEELLKGLEVLLEKAPELACREFFECLQKIDDYYDELYSRELTYSQFSLLCKADDKEDIFSKKQEKISKALEETSNELVKTDMLDQKEKYFDLIKERKILEDFNLRVEKFNIAYAICCPNKGRNKDKINPMENYYSLGEETANECIKIDSILKNPNLYSAEEVQAAKASKDSFLRNTYGEIDEEGKKTMEKFISRYRKYLDEKNKKFEELKENNNKELKNIKGKIAREVQDERLELERLEEKYTNEKNKRYLICQELFRR